MPFISGLPGQQPVHPMSHEYFQRHFAERVALLQVVYDLSGGGGVVADELAPKGGGPPRSEDSLMIAGGRSKVKILAISGVNWRRVTSSMIMMPRPWVASTSAWSRGEASGGGRQQRAYYW